MFAEITREDENRYILAAAVMRRDWAEVSVLHFMKADFQHRTQYHRNNINRALKSFNIDFYLLQRGGAL